VEPSGVGPLLPECEANGYADPALCAGWIGAYRYGTQNTTYIIDHLDEIEALVPEIRGRLNTTKVVVGGHSGGTASVLANAGAYQQWLEGGPVYHEVAEAPIAFFAAAPQGPTYAGFGGGFDEVTSFVEISRPFLFITGVGDETGEPVPTRTTAWFTMQPENKLLVWDTQKEAKHETMDIDRCDGELRANHCLWIASVGLAFLDAVVRERKLAIQWLTSDAFETATGGEIELYRR
jgi:hypothetical protein